MSLGVGKHISFICPTGQQPFLLKKVLYNTLLPAAGESQFETPAKGFRYVIESADGDAARYLWVRQTATLSVNREAATIEPDYMYSSVV